MKYKRGVIWFRNDLRIHDNEVLNRAAEECQEVIPVYVLDDSEFQLNQWDLKPTGSYRINFLFESLENLNSSLEALNSGLVIAQGKTEDILEELCKSYDVEVIYAHHEFTTDEIRIEKKLKAIANLQLIWTSTLYHIDDLPMSIEDIPKHFTPFRQKIEKHSKLREIAESPVKIKSPELPAFTLPGFSQLGLEAPVTDPRAFKYKGGEDAGLERMNNYLFETGNVSEYKETRNQLAGDNYSSRLSPWLSKGCVSPRMLYWQLKSFESRVIKNESTYWLYFELLWRDYFKFVSLQQGAKLFYRKGFTGNGEETYFDREEFSLWCQGKTEYPLINAFMNELSLSGYMSNRGRQIVSSYFCKDLKLDWRAGAAWFEYLLIDYDPASNYGNWAYQAGVGNDPRKDRRFNIQLQTEKFDPQHEFINTWTEGEGIQKNLF